MARESILYKSDYPYSDLAYGIIAAIIISIALSKLLFDFDNQLMDWILSICFFLSMSFCILYFFGKRVLIKSDCIELNFLILSSARNKIVDYNNIERVVLNNSVYASKPIMSIYYKLNSPSIEVFKCEVYWDQRRLANLMSDKHVSFVQR
jgi:hypothetical protein